MIIKHTSISDTFKHLLEEQAKLKQRELETPEGEPMFNEDDIISTPHPLMKLLRGIFFIRNITLECFSSRIRLYAAQVLGLTPAKVNSQRGNALKHLKYNDELTYRKFNQFFCGVLGYTIKDITVTIITDDGEEVQYSVSDFAKSKEELTNMKRK